MLINVILIALWFALVNFWLTRHLGTTNLGVLVGVPFGAAAFTYVVDFLIDPNEQEEIKNGLRNKIKRHLNQRVIGILYLLSFIVAMTVTSIHIMPLADNNIRNVSLTALNAEKPISTAQTQPSKPTRFLVFINPFSNEYTLGLAGYLDKVIALQPFIGTTIVPKRDLMQQPTLLFRPAGQSNALLANKGWFELYRQNKAGKFEKLTEQQGKSAWFHGPVRQQPSSLHNDWRLELTATNTNATTAAILLLRWRNPKPLALKSDIVPGQLICALIINVDRQQYSAGMVSKVTSAPYQDLPIFDFIQEDLKNELENISHSADSVCSWLAKGAG